MANPTFVSFIGAGNLAWHMAPALDNRGFVVREVYSRNPHHAELLTERLYQAEVKATLDFSTSESILFIIAVADDSIEEVSREIILPEDAILVHTSGSKPLSELQYAAVNQTGVFYPLQTFSKTKKVEFNTIPIFIESNNSETAQALVLIAQSLSDKVFNITSGERKAVHVSAVFASNFTNHLLSISEDIMRKNNLDFNWLKPLIMETVSKSLNIGPTHSQTGPAKRGDLEVLDRHLEFLQDDPAAAAIYKLISQHIIDYYQPE